MSDKNSLNISFEDLFKLIIRLIADDLKVQKHFHNLSLIGLDTTPLHLNLHEGIFILAGFKEKDISDEIRQWYFQKAELVFQLDPVKDENELLKLASEMLNGLLQKRKDGFSN